MIEDTQISQAKDRFKKGFKENPEALEFLTKAIKSGARGLNAMMACDKYKDEEFKTLVDVLDQELVHNIAIKYKDNPVATKYIMDTIYSKALNADLSSLALDARIISTMRGCEVIPETKLDVVNDLVEILDQDEIYKAATILKENPKSLSLAMETITYLAYFGSYGRGTRASFFKNVAKLAIMLKDNPEKMKPAMEEVKARYSLSTEYTYLNDISKRKKIIS